MRATELSAANLAPHFMVFDGGAAVPREYATLLSPLRIRVRRHDLLLRTVLSACVSRADLSFRSRPDGRHFGSDCRPRQGLMTAALKVATSMMPMAAPNSMAAHNCPQNWTATTAAAAARGT